MKSPIIQSEDFYPFGLTFNSSQRENAAKNKYLYNQGSGEKKFNTERIFDLELNVDQSRHRTYDYITGRWWQVDPKGESAGQESWSTYHYSYNNPILNNDPEGDCGPCVLAIPAIVEGLAALSIGEGVLFAATGATAAVTTYELSKNTTETFDAVPSSFSGPVSGTNANGVYPSIDKPDKTEPPPGTNDKTGPRTEPVDLPEKLTLDEAQAGVGKQIMQYGKLKDPKYDQQTVTKDKIAHDHGDGTQTEIHYDRDRASGEGEGFKFKDTPNSRVNIPIKKVEMP